MVDKILNKTQYCYFHNTPNHDYSECKDLKTKCKFCNKFITEGNCPHKLPRIRNTLKNQRQEFKNIKDLSFIIQLPRLHSQTNLQTLTNRPREEEEELKTLLEEAT
jgi:hypothetical protein